MPIYQLLSASFCSIVLLSNILSAKMTTLPFLGISIPAGLFCYPLTFFLSDLVTEIFGTKRAKLMVYTALGISLFSFGLIQFALAIGADGPFQSALELGGLRIFSSLVAYISAQIAGVRIYAAIKRWSGPKWLWLRNNGAAFASQIIDTVLIDMIFLWWGLNMPFSTVAPIMLFSYLYKMLFSAACTPFFYFLVFLTKGKRI